MRENNNQRTELHIHTKMSNMESVVDVEKAVIDAALLGLKAIAITDINSVQAFPYAAKAVEKAEKMNHHIKVFYGMEGIIQSAESKKQNHILLFAKNEIGLKNLYKLVSLFNPDTPSDISVISEEKLIEYSDGLLFGNCFGQDELFEAIVSNMPWDMLCKLASRYDFLEVQPVSNCRFYTERSLTEDTNIIQSYIKTIIKLGEELHIPVCATGNVHFLHPEDETAFKVLQLKQGKSFTKKEVPLYLRDTVDMLFEFDFLDKKTARKIVIENPNKIADMMETLEFSLYSKVFPYIENDDKKLEEIVRSKAVNIYGNPLPKCIEERLNKEFKNIKHFATVYLLIYELVDKSKKLGYPIVTSSNIGSSLIAYFAGITEINPLVPHYVCKHCHYIEFLDEQLVGSGFDLPNKKCPKCGEDLYGDGHNIPFETLIGLNGEKMWDIVYDLLSEDKKRVYEYLKELFTSWKNRTAGSIFRAGSRSASNWIKAYENETGIVFDNTEKESLINTLCGVKVQSNRENNTRLLVIPDREHFTIPLDYLMSNDSVTANSHINYHFYQGKVLSFDNKSHYGLTILKRLEDFTGVPWNSVPVNDLKVCSLMVSPEALGISEDIGRRTGTLALPELGSLFMQDLLIRTKPKNFSELVKFYGLSHSEGMWCFNIDYLMDCGMFDLSQPIFSQEDIMIFLMQKGIEKEIAYNISEIAKIGLGEDERHNKLLLERGYINLMKEHGVPESYIFHLESTYDIVIKARACFYAMITLKMAWYKLYYPTEFYNAYFSERIISPKVLSVLKENGKVQEEMHAMYHKLNETIKIYGKHAPLWFYEDSDVFNDLVVLKEMEDSGIEYGIISD